MDVCVFVYVCIFGDNFLLTILGVRIIRLEWFKKHSIFIDEEMCEQVTATAQGAWLIQSNGTTNSKQRQWYNEFD